MEQFKEILENLGYKLHDRGREWRMRPLYRSSDNENSLRVFKKDGRWADFGDNNGGDFEKLIKITLGLKTSEEASVWLKSKSYEKVVVPVTEKLEFQQNFNIEDYKDIQQDYTYWQNRGISKETLDLFKGGIVKTGVGTSMYKRYVFPIFNSRNEWVGVAGRWLGPDDKRNENTPKWKLQAAGMGGSNAWCYPAFINKNILLKEKRVVLVESIGDFLSLWEAGVQYGLVLFGVNLGRAILKSLIALNPEEIIISTNNDVGNNYVGNKAAVTIKNQLVNFFDPEQIKIVLPPKNDWNMVGVKTIKEIFNVK